MRDTNNKSSEQAQKLSQQKELLHRYVELKEREKRGLIILRDELEISTKGKSVIVENCQK